MNDQLAIERARLSLLLRAVPVSIIGDLLKDPGICSKYDLKIDRTVTIAGSTVKLHDLFEAMRSLIDNGVVVDLRDNSGRKIDATISLAQDSSISIQIGATLKRFSYAILFSASTEVRTNGLNKLLLQRPLSSTLQASVRERVARPNFSCDDFYVIAENSLSNSIVRVRT